MVSYPVLSDVDSFLVYMMGIELDRQGRHLLHANRELRKALRRGDSLGALFYLDALLRCAAAISRILWPSRAKYKPRGRLLRRLFRVAGRSPFAHRAVRNAFEHFDERLEDWLAGETLVVDSSIGPKNSFIGQSTLRHLRHLEPISMEASFLDESLRIDPLVRAARGLRPKMRGITFMLDAHLDAM